MALIIVVGFEQNEEIDQSYQEDPAKVPINPINNDGLKQ